jgi:hypothetical protein
MARFESAVADSVRSLRHFDFSPDSVSTDNHDSIDLPIEQGNSINDRILKLLDNPPYVSMAVDASTIRKRHFRDFIPPAPQRFAPFLFNAVEGEFPTAQAYGVEVARVIMELHRRKVFFRCRQ